ncbi:60S acidic ribosomal protein P0-1 [Morus notabilis]|uniref:60S acidic ribosomal protein P0-1 n=1 Tax=Morus notabilis TaxID=981085 RepID=W9SDU7_9ROSA|nr:60S acidic ribosomal protein P0-1 [Morus notabilis]
MESSNSNIGHHVLQMIATTSSSIVHVGAPARAGLVAPDDVVVPPGNTGLRSFSNFLLSGNFIPKTTLSISQPRSTKVLLSKLGIRPFSYALVVLCAYDQGSVFSSEVLDLTDDDLVEKFAVGVATLTSASLDLSYPTIAAAPHMLINAYKNIQDVGVATEYSFPQVESVKEYLKDPSKFVVTSQVPVAAVADIGVGPTGDAAAKEDKNDEEEEEEDDKILGLFD